MEISTSISNALQRYSHCLAKACLVTLLWGLPVVSEAGNVFIVSSRDSGIHDSIARETRQRLDRSLPQGTEVRVIYPGQQGTVTSAAGKDDLVIAIGTEAYAELLTSGTRARILATLIPRSTYFALTEKSGREPGLTSAVFIEQSYKRSLDLVRITLPGRTVGTLVGHRSTELYEQLAREQQKSSQGIYLKKLEEGGNLIAALEQVIAHSKVLIAYADPEVSNRNTAQHILLTSYRYGVPLVAYSRAYVRAGAMMAVYSKPEQYAQQAAEIALNAINGGRQLPAPQYPKYFSVDVNHSVAHSLGIDLKPVKQIEQQLRSMAVANE